MKKFILAIFLSVLSSCAHGPIRAEESSSKPVTPTQSGILRVNGTDIYYEIYGQGEPLVLLHGGGSDIQVSFGRGISTLARHFRVIAIDEQGHGKSPASSRPFGFTHTADDIAAALKLLNIDKAKFLGFSNGATTGMYIAIRHPGLLTGMVLGSGLYRREGAPPEFWGFIKKASLDSMPNELKAAYLCNGSPEGLRKMFEYDTERMRLFRDIPERSIRKVGIPVLIMQTDQDVPTLEHGLRVMRLLPKGRFAVLPGPHDNFIGSVSKDAPALAQASLNIMIEFLKAPAN